MRNKRTLMRVNVPAVQEARGEMPLEEVAFETKNHLTIGRNTAYRVENEGVATAKTLRAFAMRSFG